MQKGTKSKTQTKTIGKLLNEGIYISLPAKELTKLESMLEGTERSLVDSLVNVRSARNWITEIQIRAGIKAANQALVKSGEVIDKLEKVEDKVKTIKTDLDGHTGEGGNVEQPKGDQKTTN